MRRSPSPRATKSRSRRMIWLRHVLTARPLYQRFSNHFGAIISTFQQPPRTFQIVGNRRQRLVELVCQRGGHFAHGGQTGNMHELGLKLLQASFGLWRSVRSRINPVKKALVPDFISPTANSMGKVEPSLRSPTTTTSNSDDAALPRRANTGRGRRRDFPDTATASASGCSFRYVRRLIAEQSLGRQTESCTIPVHQSPPSRRGLSRG